MPPSRRRIVDEAESRIRAALQADDRPLALTAASEAYAEPLLEFLVHMLDSPVDGEDVWSATWEKITTSIHTFRGESSFWTWAARIARNAAVDHREARARGPHLTTGVDRLASRDSVARRLGTVVRSTPEYLRSSFRDRFGAILERLSDEERALLNLRCEHGLSWEDVARALAPGESPLDAHELHAASAARRKQYERLRRTIRTLAVDVGLRRPS